jgi:uncharacterized protein
VAQADDEEIEMPVRAGWIVAGGAALGVAAVVGVALMDDDSDVARAALPAAVQQQGEPGVTARSVTVTGTGRAKGAPDTVTLFLGARAQAETANEALQIVNENANQLLDVLEGAGVPKEDVQTTNVSLYPTFSQNGQTITGYAAENTVTVTVRDVTKAGPVIDAASGAVGDELTLGGISFSIDDPEPLRVEARESAVAQARTQAAQLAELAGGELGDVLAVTDGSVQVSPPIVYERAAADAAQEGGAPIEPGSQEVAVNVTVTFELT